MLPGSFEYELKQMNNFIYKYNICLKDKIITCMVHMFSAKECCGLICCIFYYLFFGVGSSKFWGDYSYPQNLSGYKKNRECMNIQVNIYLFEGFLL